MTKRTQQVNYAIQRHDAQFGEWDTIRDTITPIEARARAIAAVEAEPRCEFRLVKLDTQTTITPIKIEP